MKSVIKQGEACSVGMKLINAINQMLPNEKIVQGSKTGLWHIINEKDRDYKCNGSAITYKEATGENISNDFDIIKE